MTDSLENHIMRCISVGPADELENLVPGFKHLAWALCVAETPDQETLDRVRYEIEEYILDVRPAGENWWCCVPVPTAELIDLHTVPVYVLYREPSGRVMIYRYDVGPRDNKENISD